MRNLVLIAALVFGGPALAAPPKVPAGPPVIEVVEVAEQYNLIHVEALSETATGHAWFIDGPRGFEDIVKLSPDSKRIVFTGPPGRYKLMLVVQTKGGMLDQAHRIMFIEGIGPEPDPEPDPDPDPPMPGVRWLIIIEETDQRTNAHAAIYHSEKLNAYLKAKGHPPRRLWDQDELDPNGKTPKSLKPYLNLADRDSLPVCFVADAGGRILHQGPLPVDADAVLDLLKEHGG